jgi:hypothetical protein
MTSVIDEWMSWGKFGWMISTGEKPVPEQLCRRQVPHRLAWSWTLVSSDRLPDRRQGLLPHYSTERRSKKSCPMLKKYHAMNSYGWSGSISPCILNLGIWWRCVVRFTTQQLYAWGNWQRWPPDRRLNPPSPQRRSEFIITLREVSLESDV